MHLVDKAPVLAYSRNTLNDTNSFRDDSGYPFAIVVAEDWNPPLAGVDMGLAYPEFVEHIRSNGSNNPQWYLGPDANQVKTVPVSHWKW